MKVREITVGLGLSVEVKKTWYKMNVELKIDEVEGATREQRDSAFTQAFKELQDNIEKQILELTGE